MQECDTKSLNGIKGIGAFIIAFIWHYKNWSNQMIAMPFEKIFYLSYQHGYLMVELFFMLSGFGMMMGYSEKIINHKISFVSYMWRRIKKIYPLFFITLLFVTCLQALYFVKTGELFIGSFFNLYYLFLNVLLLQNGYLGTEFTFNVPAWCISIYILLYIVYYFLAYHSKDKKVLIYKLLAIGMLGLCIFVWGINIPLLNYQTARGFSCFSIGALLAYIYECREKINIKFISYCSLFSLIIIYLFVRFINYDIDNFQVLFIIALAPMIIITSLFIKQVNSILCLRLFGYLGSISLEIYLIHMAIRLFFETISAYSGVNFNYSCCLTWFECMILTIGLATIYKQLLRDKMEKLFEKLLWGGTMSD